jgi:AcrR family transcriptional regulator
VPPVSKLVVVLKEFGVSRGASQPADPASFAPESPVSHAPESPESHAPEPPEQSAPAAAAAVKPLRADARRNRDQLLAAAVELFDERGVEAPLEEIARRAGVGIGTLYRHFPTRDAVIEAVYRNEVEKLCGNVDELIRDLPAADALATWMRSFAVYVARKRGMATALKAALGDAAELFHETRARAMSAMTQLLENASQAGVIRDDVDPDDVLRAMSGICMATDAPDYAERTARLVDLLMDGLRYGARNPAR